MCFNDLFCPIFEGRMLSSERVMSIIHLFINLWDATNASSCVLVQRFICTQLLSGRSLEVSREISPSLQLKLETFAIQLSAKSGDLTTFYAVTFQSISDATRTTLHHN